MLFSEKKSCHFFICYSLHMENCGAVSAWLWHNLGIFVCVSCGKAKQGRGNRVQSGEVALELK